MGSNPPPGIRLVIVGAGAKRERALASSGILPEEQKSLLPKARPPLKCYFSIYHYPST